MPLIDCGIGGEKIIITIPFDIPDKNTFALFQNHRKRMVIVSPVALFTFYKIM